MPESHYIDQLRRRLAELGCPVKHVRRLVQEMADHREDLIQAARAEGLLEAGAETRAEVQLGDPLVLAEQMMMTVRRSSWWGRHYVVAFGLLPVLAYPVLWILLLASELLLAVALGYGWDWKKLHAAANNPVAFYHLFLAVHCMDYLAIALVALLFCWLARRAAVKFRWMVVSCAICSLLAANSCILLKPHSFSLSFSGSGNVNDLFGIELVALLCCLLARKMPVKLKWIVISGVICSLLAFIIATGFGSHSFSFGGGSVVGHPVMPWLRGTIPLLVVGAAYVVQRWTARRFQREVALSP